MRTRASLALILGLTMAWAGMAQGEGGLDKGRVARRVEAHLDSLARAGEFSGTVLLAEDGVPFLRRAYSLASRDPQVPNRPDTKFNLGSIDKIFTKIAIAQLAQQGKLRLDDTLDRYLPDYPREAAHRIRVQDLVEHRAGVGDIFGPRYNAVDHRT